jgi:4-amino-4-deoxy-L-arabinose transferase-like glycosyltransferase
MRSKVVLIIIVIIGFILRFYDLGNIPNSLNWDEVSWGYNAYSILKTGRDEHGNFMPLSFKAFGDYKQPTYVYLDVLPIRLFGLNPFAVRFPSALFGALSIIAIYYLANEIFRKTDKRDELGMIAAALFALSPWSIQFSRVAYEANVAIFFIISGAAVYLHAARNNRPILAALGVLLLGISTYSYHSAKVFTPLIFIALTILIFYRYELSKKTCAIFAIVFLLICAPWLTDSRTTARGRSVTFTSYQTSLLKNDLEKIEEDNVSNYPFADIIHNRRYVYLNIYLKNYLMHFDPSYLFLEGDDARHHAPGVGIVYIFCLPFILIGLFQIAKKRNDAGLLVIFWLLTAPLASALAIDSPNASRSLVMLPAVILISSVGLKTTLYSFSERRKYLLLIILIFCYLLNVLYYLNSYFAFTNKYHGLYWQYGYRQAVEFTRQFKNKKVFFLNNIEQGYIFYLFYEKYDPSKYIADGGSQRRENNCFAIDNRYFGNCESEVSSGDMYVTTGKQIKNKDKAVKKIKVNDEYDIAIYRSQ